MINEMADNMYSDHRDWQRTILGHSFTLPRTCDGYGEGCTLVNGFRTWLRTHEEAQVMIASILVVVGLWWLVRTILTLLINLVFPLMVVLLAVICIPQLRTPLLGQNYPMVAKLMQNIFLKMAENINTQ